MRYNSIMGKLRKESKSANEAGRSILRRIRLPIFTIIICLAAAFIVIPFIFDLLHPMVAYSDISMPVAPAADIPAAPVAPIKTPEPVIADETSQEAVIEAINDTAQVKTLSLGDEDPKVAEIQLRLMDLGYLDGDEPTEKFGEQTQNALQRFQRTHYMAQTGVADELTQSILFSGDAKVYSLEKGNDGDDVLKLQKQLGDLGYYSDKSNGYFGVATSRALSAFQTKNKLDASGVADGDTLDLLYSSKARPKIDPTPTPKPTKSPKPSKTPKYTNGDSTPVKTDSGSGGGSIIQVGSGVEAFISVAMAQEGKPYRYSNEGPDSYDCSGLVYFSLRSVGVSVGRMAAKNFATVDSWQTVPNKALLARGDLLFFTNSTGSATIGHTGIFLGGNKFIHASSSAGRVVVSTWSDWCETNFQWGKRVF